MDLIDGAYTAEFAGKIQYVIEDAPLLEWAEENGIDHCDAPVKALENGVIPLRYFKNFHSVGFAEQIRICKSKVFICGCGGLGGILINLLARAGVGRLYMVDGDAFAPSNLNRQWLCESKEIGRSKAEVASERVHAINPFTKTEALRQVLDERNAVGLAQGSDLILDALDNIEGRFILAKAARLLSLPFIHAAVAGWWGQICTLLPGSRIDLQSVYGKKRSRDSTEDRLGVPGPVPAVIGSLQALEALRILSGKKAAYADSLLYFDGESGRTEIAPL